MPGERAKASFDPNLVRPAKFVDSGGGVYNIKAFGADCTAKTDSTSAINAAQIAANGGTVVIPTNCKLLLATPTKRICNSGTNVGLACTTDDQTGTGCPGSICASGGGCCNYTAVVTKSKTQFYCEDSSAGFIPARRYCVGGTYPLTWCSADADCIGGGVCKSDLPSGVFAPTSGTTYTMFWGEALSELQSFQNCSFWVYQADDTQRCNGGTSNGLPCKQYCDTSGTPILPGVKCETDANCPISGFCLGVASCKTGGGTCSTGPVAAKGSLIGAGDVNVLDLGQATTTDLRKLRIYDSFWGNGTNGAQIRLGPYSLVADVDTAAAISDGECTTPSCVSNPTGAKGRLCAYYDQGIASSHDVTLAASYGIDQPKPTFAYGIVGGQRTRIFRTIARIGAVAGFSPGASSWIDQSITYPPSSYGPGRPSTGGIGILSSGSSYIAKTNIPLVEATGTGIKTNGGDVVIANQIGNTVSPLDASGFSGGANGILLNGTSDVALENQINAAGKGIYLHGSYDIANDNEITFSTVGIYADGDSETEIANRVTNATSYAVQIASTGSNNSLSTNRLIVTSAATAVIYSLAAYGAIVSNNIQGTGANAACILEDMFMGRILDNQIILCARGVLQSSVAFGGTASGGYNVNTSSNRFISIPGWQIARGSAGNKIEGNYFNSSGSTPKVWITSCGPTCSNRGADCIADANCSSCTASAEKCIHEGQILLGNVAESKGVAHAQVNNNLIYKGQNQYQCTTTPAGQGCDNVTCSGGTCSGTPAVWSGCTGGDIGNIGKYCCTAGSCVAQVIPMLKLPGYNAANPSTDLSITGNTFLGYNNLRAMDFRLVQDTLSSLKSANISGNIVELSINSVGSDCTNSVAIDFQASSANFAGITIAANNLKGYCTGQVEVNNWLPTYGDWAEMPVSSIAIPDVAEHTSTQTVTSLTTRNVTYFQTPETITVNQVSLWISAVTTAGTLKVCVYSENGGAKMIDVTTGAPSAGAILTTTVSPGVRLPPGGYYIAVGCATTCNDTMVSGIVETTSTMFGAGTPSGKLPWHGTATHTSGTCNSTLGTVTGTTAKPGGFRLDN